MLKLVILECIKPMMSGMSDDIGILMQQEDKKTVIMRAFSLVEVVMALGIVSFAMVGLMGLLTVAIGTSKDSIDATRQTQIVQKIFAEAQLTVWEKKEGRYQFVPVKSIYYFSFDGAELTASKDAQYTVYVTPTNLLLPGALVPPDASYATNLVVGIVNRTKSTTTNSYNSVLVRTGL